MVTETFLNINRPEADEDEVAFGTLQGVHRSDQDALGTCGEHGRMFQAGQLWA